jgi:hypothetical protein
MTTGPPNPTTYFWGLRFHLPSRVLARDSIVEQRRCARVESVEGSHGRFSHALEGKEEYIHLTPLNLDTHEYPLYEQNMMACQTVAGSRIFLIRHNNAKIVEDAVLEPITMSIGATQCSNP